jgi:hypothetical protein
MFELGRNEETRNCGKLYYDTFAAVYTFYGDYLFAEYEVGEMCSLQKYLVLVEYCHGILL